MNARPAIAVFAYSELGHACLNFLFRRDENVVAVYTHADAAGEKVWFPSVEKLARAHKVPVFFEPPRVLPQPADLIFSFYYRHLIPTGILQSARLGAYNMHGSYLPKFRGRAPVNWAVLKGESYTGATLHVMVEQADAGDIVDQEKVAIGPDDTAAQVQAGVTAAAVTILARQLENLKGGSAPRHPQNPAQATYFGKRSPQDGAIDWKKPAREIHNLVRAVTHPYPGAFGDIDGKKVFVWKTALTGQKATGLRPGQTKVDDATLKIVCGDGEWLDILKTSEEIRT